MVVENALLRQQLIVLNRQIKRPQRTNPFILKNKLNSPWTIKRNRLTKFPPKIPKSLTDEASSQHRRGFRIENKGRLKGRPLLLFADKLSALL